MYRSTGSTLSGQVKGKVRFDIRIQLLSLIKTGRLFTVLSGAKGKMSSAIYTILTDRIKKVVLSIITDILKPI